MITFVTIFKKTLKFSQNLPIYILEIRSEEKMFDDLKNEGIIIEFGDLVNKAEDFKNDIDAYCKFMKEMFLGTSCQN